MERSRRAPTFAKYFPSTMHSPSLNWHAPWPGMLSTNSQVVWFLKNYSEMFDCLLEVVHRLNETSDRRLSISLFDKAVATDNKLHGTCTRSAASVDSCPPAVAVRARYTNSCRAATYRRYVDACHLPATDETNGRKAAGGAWPRRLLLPRAQQAAFGLVHAAAVPRP